MPPSEPCSLEALLLCHARKGTEHSHTWSCQYNCIQGLVGWEQQLLWAQHRARFVGLPMLSHQPLR